ncbi:MAG: type II toxin-antitoxin system HicB family antitoxin [Nitrospinota bacterium]
MRDTMEYKGYLGSVRYSDEDEVFHGKIEFIRDLVTFEGTDVKSLKNAFRGAVEDYLAQCRKEKKKPNTPFKGSFNVRVGPELHRKAAILAISSGKKTLNSVVTEALSEHLGKVAATG